MRTAREVGSGLSAQPLCLGVVKRRALGQAAGAEVRNCKSPCRFNYGASQRKPGDIAPRLFEKSHKRPLPWSKPASRLARRPSPLMGEMQPSDIDLLRDLDSIVDLDAEVPHGALDLGMSQ